MGETAAFTFETVTIGSFLLIAGVAVFAAVISGMSGFGGGLIISAFLAPIVGVKALIPVMGVVMLLNNASRVWVYRHALDLKTAVLVAGAAVPMTILGTWVYADLNDEFIAAILGFILIGSVPLRRWLAYKKVQFGQKGLGAFGFVFGFMNSTMLGTGMLIIPVLMGAGLFGPALLATDAAIATGVNIVKSLMFGTYDVLTPALATAGLVIGLCTIPGTWVAAWIIRLTDIRMHTLIMEGLIICGGLSFFWRFGHQMGWY